jgi:hypothetical protein
MGWSRPVIVILGPDPIATVFRVKPFFIAEDEFQGPGKRATIVIRDAPGHAMIARVCRPVQGRFAPAMPVAFGNP